MLLVVRRCGRVDEEQAEDPVRRDSMRLLRWVLAGSTLNPNPAPLLTLPVF